MYQLLGGLVRVDFQEAYLDDMVGAYVNACSLEVEEYDGLF